MSLVEVLKWIPKNKQKKFLHRGQALHTGWRGRCMCVEMRGPEKVKELQEWLTQSAGVVGKFTAPGYQRGLTGCWAGLGTALQAVWQVSFDSNVI